MPSHMRALPKPKPGSATAMRRARTRLAHARFLAACALVRERDAGRCRACGASGWAEVHHIRYRSRGGSHEPSNLVLLCKACHDAVHAGRLAIEGDADDTLRITRPGIMWLRESRAPHMRVER